MASVRKAVSQLATELDVFGSQLANEIDELKRNVEVKPITGATLYRHCLEDLNDRLTSIGEDLATLEAVSLDAISLEELVGHCAALYTENHKAITALETKIRSFGYRDVYSPLPPENALDLMAILQSSTRKSNKPFAAANLSASGSFNDDEDEDLLLAQDLIPTGRYSDPDPHTTNNNRNSFSPMDPHAGIPAAAGGLLNTKQKQGGGGVPPTSSVRRAGGVVPSRPTALEAAMAPMTAMKSRMRDDTPSSMSSPELMSPSMRALLGKYASSSSGGSLNLSLPGSIAPHHQQQNTTGNKAAAAGAAPRPSVSPLLLSPAFQQAAAHQRAQLQAAEASAMHQNGAVGSGATPMSIVGAQERVHAHNEAVTLTAQKLSARPDLVEQYRHRFPHVVASAELLASEAAPAAAAAGGGPVSRHMDEESTMELKAQVIFNRQVAEARERAKQAEERTAQTYHRQPPPAPAASHITDVANTPAVVGPPTTATALQGGLGNHPHTGGTAAAPTTTGGNGSTVYTAPRTGTSTGIGMGSIISTSHASLRSIGAGPVSTGGNKGPLPAVVPALRTFDEADYSSLPAFIRGQVTLETLNATARAVHAEAMRKCEAGAGPGFTMDDVEATGLLPVGKGKVFANALVKLGHLQLRVLLGEGTVYFFV